VARRKRKIIGATTRDPIREDERRRAIEKLEALLLEGSASGPPIEVTPEYWKEKAPRFCSSS
jgi:hypothetical protein